MVGADRLQDPGCPSTVVVLADGDAPPDEVLARIGAPDHVVAADGGARHAVAAGWSVDDLVGDLDSIPSPLLARLGDAGTRVHALPAAKDLTDLEAAMELAVATAGDRDARIVVLGVGGGRADHEMANLGVVASTRWAGVAVTAWLGASRVDVLHPVRPLVLHARIGATVSLLPWGGSAECVTTEGLLYPLAGEDLPAGTSRGVSNEVVSTPAHVRLAGGVLLAVRPPDPRQEDRP